MSPLRSRDFRLLLIATTAVFSGFALLLPVVPLWLVRQGAGDFAAGWSTGGFMAATVAAQLTVPGLVARLGYPKVTAVGALLLGAPAPLLLVTRDWPGVLAVSLARGIGFGLVTVCGAALIAELLPRAALARGSGLYGFAVGLPQLVGLPAGTWAAEHWGFGQVFLVATVLPMLGLVPLALLPPITAEVQARTGRSSTVRFIWRPWLVMLGGAVGYGSLVTFLPIVLSGTAGAGPAALFAAAAGALVSRWAAGHAGDRLVPGRMLAWALAACVLGLAGAAPATGHGQVGAGVVVAAAVFGIGFGVVQNDSLVVMFAGAGAGPASVAWNVAFDAGTGLGAIAVGAAVSRTGYPAAFLLPAAFGLVLLPIAGWVRRSG